MQIHVLPVISSTSTVLHVLTALTDFKTSDLLHISCSTLLGVVLSVFQNILERNPVLLFGMVRLLPTYPPKI